MTSHGPASHLMGPFIDVVYHFLLLVQLEYHWLCLDSALVWFLGQLRSEGSFLDDIRRPILVGFGFHFSGGENNYAINTFWLQACNLLRFDAWSPASSQD